MGRLIALTIFLLLTAAAPVSAKPAPLDRAKVKALDRYLKSRVRTTPLAALVVSFDLGGARFSRAYGFQDIENKVPATVKTSFRYASVTKPMTAVALLRLQELGKLDVDAPVQRYVPYFPKKKFELSSRHLAGMLGGIPHYVNCDVECHIKEPYTTRQSIGIFKTWPLYHPPGAQFMYSSYQYNLLGAVLEGAAKRPYEKIMQRYVWGPARMRSAQMDVAGVVDPLRAKGYRISGRRLVESEFVDVSSRFAGGGTRGTAGDIVRFGKALMAGKLLSPSSLEEMTSTMTTNDGENTDYGFGMGTYPLGGRWFLMHSGGQPETSTLLAILPTEDLVIGIAMNVEMQRALSLSIVDKIIEIFLSEGHVRRKLAGKGPVADLVAKSAYKTFSHGVARARLHGSRAELPIVPLLEAFGRFNDMMNEELLAADIEGARAFLDRADDPSGGSVFPLVGQHMAATVSEHRGAAHVDALYKRGAFALLIDYHEACLEFDCATGLSLDDVVVDSARKFDQDLQRAALLSTTHLSRKTSANELKALLAPLENARVLPDLSKEIAKVASPRILARKRKARLASRAEAEALLELSAAYFPQSDTAAISAAEARLLAGDNDGARELFKRWSELTTSETPDKSLARQARALKRRHAAESEVLLDIARELFPNSEALPAKQE